MSTKKKNDTLSMAANGGDQGLRSDIKLSDHMWLQVQSNVQPEPDFTGNCKYFRHAGKNLRMLTLLSIATNYTICFHDKIETSIG